MERHIQDIPITLAVTAQDMAALHAVYSHGEMETDPGTAEFLLAIARLRPGLRLATRPIEGRADRVLLVCLLPWRAVIRTGFDEPVTDKGDFYRDITGVTFERRVWAHDEAQACERAQKIAADYTAAFRTETDEPATVVSVERMAEGDIP